MTPTITHAIASIVQITILAFVLQRIVELAKPIFPPLIQKGIPYVTFVAGIALALVYGADMLALAGFPPNLAGQVLTGIAIGGGSNFIHDLWMALISAASGTTSTGSATPPAQNGPTDALTGPATRDPGSPSPSAFYGPSLEPVRMPSNVVRFESLDGTAVEKVIGHPTVDFTDGIPREGTQIGTGWYLHGATPLEAPDPVFFYGLDRTTMQDRLLEKVPLTLASVLNLNLLAPPKRWLDPAKARQLEAAGVDVRAIAEATLAVEAADPHILRDSGARIYPLPQQQPQGGAA